jgi:hypothetical protein
MAESIVLEQNIGKNLWHIMSQTLAKSTSEVFKEFVSNSYDADAEHVKITVDAIDDLLVIADDGVGMDEAGIQDFFRMGDSEKVRNPVSPKGRTKIGQFGIATVLLEYLGSAYTLETWKDGTKITLHEDFAARKNDLEWSADTAEPLLHGTTLTFRGLSFTNDPSFSDASLRKALGMEFRSVSDFHVDVNGKAVQHTVAQPTRSFPVDLVLPHAGKVTGDIHYYADGAPSPGIYIYVNTRAVGQPSLFDLSSVHFGLAGKVTGAIDADGLQRYISFDRSRLKEDNPATTELIREIYHQLRNVRTELAHDKRTAARALSRTIVPNTLDRVGSLISAVDIQKLDAVAEKASDRNIKQQLTLAGKQTPKGEQHLEFVVVDRPSSAGMAVYDEVNSVIEINANHPSFSVSMRGADYLLHVQFMHAAAVAIGRRMTENQAGQDVVDHLRERVSRIAALSQKVFDAQSNLLSFLESHTVFSDEQTDIRPLRMYTGHELKEILGMDLVVLNRLGISGLLCPRRGDLYIGSDVLAVMKKMSGYVPVCGIVKDYEEPRGFSRQAVEIVYKGIDEKLSAYRDQIDYIKDIGVDKPFFIVEEEQKQKFLTLYASKRIRKYLRNPKPLPQALARRDYDPREEMLSLYQAEQALGLKLADVMDLIDRARLDGNHIRTIRTENGLRYNLSDMENSRK